MFRLEESDAIVAVLATNEIVRVYRDSNYALALELSGGQFVTIEAIGDCCSYSWVEHVNGLEDLIGARIVSIQEAIETGNETRTNEDGSESDYVCIYRSTFITAKGHAIDIEYRNASNGYYGGWLEFDVFDLTDGEGFADSWRAVSESF